MMKDYELVQAKDDLEKVEEGEAVKVTAPANLPGGYEFEVIHDGKPFIATAPEGGALAGDVFVSNLREVMNPHNIPRGVWRDGVFDIGTHCGTFLVSWCCAPWSLAQVMVRMKIDCLGRPNGGCFSAFKTVAYGWLFILALSYVQGFMTGAYGSPDGDVLPPWLAFLLVLRVLLSIFHGLYTCVMFCITRNHIRQRYSIPATSCPSECPNCFEDCCWSCCCPCLALSQMHRHTADYSKYAWFCCTENGLDKEAPREF